MEEIAINSSVIQLDQFLKWAGIVESGGQVKSLVDAKAIMVNNRIVIERRKKIIPGDIIELRGSGTWKVIGPQG